MTDFALTGYVFTGNPDPLVRPDLTSMIASLMLTDSRFPWVKPTDDEADAAELIHHITSTHQGSVDCDDPDEPSHVARTWGICSRCGTSWPCLKWREAQALAIEFVGRAHNRYAAHAKAAIGRLKAAEKAHRESA